MSHPTMGAWIEISYSLHLRPSSACRTPRWVRGLKFEATEENKKRILSHPTMGAWIEIF